MTHRWIALVIMFYQAFTAHAAVCGFLPPCQRVHTESILFVGSVIHAGVPKDQNEWSSRDVVLRTEEVFAGLPRDTHEVSVRAEGDWLEKGETYLIDAIRDEEGVLHVAPCGSSGLVSDSDVSEFLEYLRKRLNGNTSTTLSVHVTDQFRGVPGVLVVATGPKEKRSALTDADGAVDFDDALPGHYEVSVESQHYRSGDPQKVEVLPGACSAETIEVSADGEVSGFVFDKKGLPVSALTLDLAVIEESESRWPTSFQAETDSQGRFHFKGVSPGHYHLGTNIQSLSRTSAAPRVYYPGSPTIHGAIPIDVKLGSSIEGISFIFPDSRRVIEICVVHESGRHAPEAFIHNANASDGEFMASLGDELRVNASGCLSVQGFAAASYRVFALASDERDLRRTLLSELVTIPATPGDGKYVLVLKAPGNQ